MKNRIFAMDVNILSDSRLFTTRLAEQRPARRDRVNRMRFDNGKRLCLGAGIVMEHALAYAGCSDREVRFTPEEKPFVDGCEFNLSHTDAVAICAVSDSPVGIDIERPRQFTGPLLRKAFTPDEIQMVEGLMHTDLPSVLPKLPALEAMCRAADCSLSDAIYTRLWTIKESVMKWFGAGLALPPEHIQISVRDEIRVTLLDEPKRRKAAASLRFTTYDYEDYRITVCSEQAPFADDIEWITE